jgi:hypothetical protein
MTGASRWILFTTIIVDARNHEPEICPNWQPDNVQYFASKEINKPDIANVVYVVKEFKM